MSVCHSIGTYRNSTRALLKQCQRGGWCWSLGLPGRRPVPRCVQNLRSEHTTCGVVKPMKFCTCLHHHRRSWRKHTLRGFSCAPLRANQLVSRQDSAVQVFWVESESVNKTSAKVRTSFSFPELPGDGRPRHTLGSLHWVPRFTIPACILHRCLRGRLDKGACLATSSSGKEWRTMKHE